jgi:hypothetical protein
MNDDVFIYSSSGRLPNGHGISGYGIGNLIKNMTDPVGCEIGVERGYTTEYFLRVNKTTKIYCIDPFANYIDWNGENKNERDMVYKEFLQRMSPFSDRVNIIKKYSDDAVNDVPDNSLDFIFIDGLHTYEQVTKDMQNYYDKVKSGGIFSGHDFSLIDCINRAVKDFAKTKGKEILTTEHDVWYWYK